MEGIIIREAVADDCEEIIRLIKELASYEKLLDQVTLTKDQLVKDGFNTASPFFKCVVAEKQDENPASQSPKELVGYALYYHCYSTFEGRSMYLEDIFVCPGYRGRGIASRMLKNVAAIAVAEGCRRIDLVILGWNKPMLDWYTRLGATDMTSKENWHLFRLSREGMERLGAGVTVNLQNKAVGLR